MFADELECFLKDVDIKEFIRNGSNMKGEKNNFLKKSSEPNKDQEKKKDISGATAQKREQSNQTTAQSAKPLAERSIIAYINNNNTPQDGIDSEMTVGATQKHVALVRVKQSEIDKLPKQLIEHTTKSNK